MRICFWQCNILKHNLSTHDCRCPQVVSCASFSRMRESATESHSNSSTTEDGDYDTAPASLVSGLEAAFSGCSSSGASSHGSSSSGSNRLEEARQAVRQALRKEEAMQAVRLRRQQPTPQPSLAPSLAPSLSSAEDESGFSSMGSFQEVGLPLLNSTTNSSSTAEHGPWHSSSMTSSRGSSHGSFHEVGLPVVGGRLVGGKPPVPIHRRWSSNPVEALTRYPGYKGPESLRVLWV